MAKSKWNNKDSFPIYELSESDLSEAIHEWAEGSKDLEELLWLCYRAKVETCGCCQTWYIDFRIEGSNREYLKKLLSIAETVETASTLLQMHAGMVSADKYWWKESVGIMTYDRGEELFQTLKKAFREDAKVTGCYHRILDLYDFIKEKEADISVSIEKSENGIYTLVFVVADSNPYLKFFDKLSRREEMRSTFWRYKRDYWYYVGCNACTAEKMNHIIDALLHFLRENWDAPIPTEFTDNMDIMEKTLLMRRKFGNSPEGIEKLNQWYNQNKPDDLEEIHY